MMESTLPPAWRDIVINNLKKQNYLKNTKKKNSSLSKVSHLATNFTNDKQTEKENTPEEVARRFWASVTNQTSQDETT